MSAPRTPAACSAWARRIALISFVSDHIEDYYLNPWELGYGSFVKFDHDYWVATPCRPSTRRPSAGR
jgi:hypothetical protein